MASVVFFRAVNVGGHQRFQPGLLAKELREFGVVNIGAAGTFVVRESVSRTKLRDAILSRLPFKPELMICPAADVLKLARSEPFRDAPNTKDVTRYVSVMDKAPRTPPPLPLELPAGKHWGIRVIAVIGRFALSIRRPGQKDFYPNAVIEKQFAVSATTRNWNTIAAIRDVLEQ